MLAAEPKLTAAGLSQELGISKRQMERRLAELKNEGRLEHVGARKNGYWKVKG